MSSLEQDTSRFLAAWMQVRQIIQAANFNRFHKAGLSATQFMTLNVITDDGITLSELARKLNLSPSTLNETVNSLEERGYLRRTRNASDRRKLTICTTARGESMQNSASRDFRSFMSRLLAQMPKGRRGRLLAGLEEMVRLSVGESTPLSMLPWMPLLRPSVVLRNLGGGDPNGRCFSRRWQRSLHRSFRVSAATQFRR